MACLCRFAGRLANRNTQFLKSSTRMMSASVEGTEQQVSDRSNISKGEQPDENTVLYAGIVVDKKKSGRSILVHVKHESNSVARVTARGGSKERVMLEEVETGMNIAVQGSLMQRYGLMKLDNNNFQTIRQHYILANKLEILSTDEDVERMRLERQERINRDMTKRLQDS